MPRQAAVKPTPVAAPAAAVVHKTDKETGLVHEFPKAMWDLLGKKRQAGFEDAPEKPAIVDAPDAD